MTEGYDKAGFGRRGLARAMWYYACCVDVSGGFEIGSEVVPGGVVLGGLCLGRCYV
jgi:hypothetical protein